MKRAVPLLLFASAAHAEPLTMRAAIDVALGKNPQISVARETVASAKEHASGVRGHYYPSLHADVIGNYYNKPFALGFMGINFPVYEQRTSVTTVTISQPLTGLAYLSELAGAADHDAAAARDEYDRTRLDVAYRTADAYLRVLEARASADVAHRSVADIASELARAEQLRAADTYTDIDVLRFRSAKAAADQSALRADSARDAALATLVVQLGMRDGSAIDVTDDLPQSPPALALTLEKAQSRALTARPELAAAREKLAAADSNRLLAYAPYVPDIRAIGQWEHTTGQPLAPPNAELIGLRLSWNLWDWGSTQSAVHEAEHAKARAEIGVEATIEEVKLDVRKRWLDAKTAFDSLAVAATQQQTAEEAYRLQQVRFEAGASTTTDVLDAETDVARARLAASVARYDYFLAMVALARAIGDLPGQTL